MGSAVTSGIRCKVLILFPQTPREFEQECVVYMLVELIYIIELDTPSYSCFAVRHYWFIDLIFISRYRVYMWLCQCVLKAEVACSGSKSSRDEGSGVHKGTEGDNTRKQMGATDGKSRDKCYAVAESRTSGSHGEHDRRPSGHKRSPSPRSNRRVCVFFIVNVTAFPVGQFCRWKIAKCLYNVFSFAVRSISNAL